MSFTPATGLIGYTDRMNQQAAQAEQDALLAQQQAAAFAQQQQQETAAYLQDLDMMVAQQQQAFDELRMREAQAQQIQQMQQAQQVAQMQATQGRTPTTGSVWADKFIADAEAGNPNTSYGQHGQSDDNATLWNRLGLEKWLDVQANANGWNDFKKQAVRKEVMAGVAAARGNKNYFQTEERDFLQAAGDMANRFAAGVVGGLADLTVLGVTAIERSINGVMGGKQTMQWSKTLADNVDAIGKYFGDLRSAEALDDEKARNQAQGMKEMLVAFQDDPIAFADEVPRLFGMMYSGGIVGNAIKKGGAALTRAGATRVLGAGGKVSGTTAEVAGLTDDIIAAGGRQVQATTGLARLGAAGSRVAGYASIGAGRAAHSIGSGIAGINPLTAAAAYEGAGTARDVLGQDGAWDEQAQTYTDDALLTAAGAGATTAAITYGAGKLFGTIEGRGASIIADRAANRAAASSLGRQVLADGSTTIDDALRAVTADMAATATPSARKVLNEAAEFLTSQQSRAALAEALPKTSPLRAVFNGGKTIAGSMLAEGVEEGLVGLVTSAATQAIAGDGVFNTSKIDSKKLINDMASAATMGAILGPIGGAMQVGREYVNSSNVLDNAIADYEARVSTALTTLDAVDTQAQAQEQARIAEEARARMIADGLLLPSPDMIAARVAEREAQAAQARIWDDRVAANRAAAEAAEAQRQADIISAGEVAAETQRRMVESGLLLPTAEAVAQRVAEDNRLDELRANAAQADAQAQAAVVAAAQERAQQQVFDTAVSVAPTPTISVSPTELVLQDALAYMPADLQQDYGKLVRLEKAYHVYQMMERELNAVPKRGNREPTTYTTKNGDTISATAANAAELKAAIDIQRQLLQADGAAERLNAWYADFTGLEYAAREAAARRDRLMTLAGSPSATKLIERFSVGRNTKLGRMVKNWFGSIKGAGAEEARTALGRYIEAVAFIDGRSDITEADIAALRAEAKARLQAVFNNTQRPDEAEASAEDLLNAVDEASSDLAEFALAQRNAAVQGAAQEEVKKLGLTPLEEVDVDEAAAVADTAAAMVHNGKSPFTPVAPRQDDLFNTEDLPTAARATRATPNRTTRKPQTIAPIAAQGDLFATPQVDLQAKADAEVEAALRMLPQDDLFTDPYDIDDDVLYAASHDKPKWDSMTQVEQQLAVEAETAKRVTRVLQMAFGRNIMKHIVLVSQLSAHAHSITANGYVVNGDPNTIYLILKPHRSDIHYVYTVAHEMLHQQVDINVRNTYTRWGDYKQTMETFMQHPFVQETMGAMRSLYAKHNLTPYELAEEALAEIHAARTTPGGWANFRKRWHITSEIPNAVMAKNGNSFIERIITWFKNFVGRLTGKRRVTDADLSEFFRVVAKRTPEAVAAVRTPERAAAHKAKMVYEAAVMRAKYYHILARKAIADFDMMPIAQQRQIMARMAMDNADTLSASELAVPARFSLEPPANPAASTTDDIPVNPERDAIHEQMRRIAAIVPPASKPDAQQALATHLVQQIRIYPSRTNTTELDPTIDDAYIGVISLVQNGRVPEVQVHMNDTANGVVGYGTSPIHVEQIQGDPMEAMNAARRWLLETYPQYAYETRTGSAYDIKAGSLLTPAEINILNRAQQMGISSPAVRKWTRWFAQRLPQQYLPVLDKFLDFVEMLRVRWVDRYAAMRNVETMYEQATGRTASVINRMMRDIGEGTAMLHRNFNSGSVMQAAGKRQSFRDRVEAIRNAMADEGVSQLELNKVIYGLEEMVRSKIMLLSPQAEGHWVKDAKGNRHLVDAKNQRYAATVTGFRFKDLNTLDPNKGEYDFGGKRFAEAMAQLPLEKRNKIGRVVAELAATSRAVIDLQQAKGVLTGAEASDRKQRGKGELRDVFPELAAQGYDFGGFFVTMRDDGSNPYTSREALGRSSAVDNVLGNTMEVWEAEIKTAYRNNEMANFALLVLSMPNNHFVVEPVAPRNNPDNPLSDPIWESSSKGEKSSMVVFVNGVPVKLVAKSKNAAMLFDAENAHPAVSKIGALNHYFNQFKTSLNPTYPLFGFGRDIMTGYMNISGAIGEQYVSPRDAATVGARAIGYALKYLVVPGQHNLFYGTAKGKMEDAWARAFQILGAGMMFGDDLNTGAFSNIGRDPLIKGEGVKVATNMLTKVYTHGKTTVAKVAETIAYPPETAMRLGAFRAYTEHLFGSQVKPNMTVDEIVALFDQAKNPQNSTIAAAVIVGSKNITSNFQQHGTDPIVRNLFSFHNAVMQGTFATLPQILATQHGRKTAALILIASAMAAAANIGDEEEDEFGNSRYFHIIGRNRAIVINEDLKIPLSDELGWIKNLSDNIVGVMMGKRNVIDASTDQFTAMADMVMANKMGQTDNAITNMLYAVTPTMAQPFIAISTGYDMFGRKLKAEFAYDSEGKAIRHAADVERTTRAATQTGSELAEFMYGATGGAVDMTGDEVDIIGAGFLGGLYRSVARTQTETMLEADGIGGIVGQFGSEFLRSSKPVYINRQLSEEWQALGERIGISMRNQGGMLDVLNAGSDTNVQEAQRIYQRAEREARKAKSDLGLTYKQLNEAIELAEKSGRSQDLRDFRADIRTIRDNADEIRAAAILEIHSLGVR